MGSTKINLVWQVFHLVALFLDILLLLPWFLIQSWDKTQDQLTTDSFLVLFQSDLQKDANCLMVMHQEMRFTGSCLPLNFHCMFNIDCCHFCRAGGLLLHEAQRAGSFAMTSYQVLLPISTGSKWLLLAQHAEKERMKIWWVALGVDVISALFFFSFLHFLSVSTSGVKWTVTSLLETVWLSQGSIGEMKVTRRSN